MVAEIIPFKEPPSLAGNTRSLLDIFDDLGFVSLNAEIQNGVLTGKRHANIFFLTAQEEKCRLLEAFIHQALAQSDPHPRADLRVQIANDRTGMTPTIDDDNTSRGRRASWPK